jgi:2-dehydropantoate 2-reductase
MKNFLVFGAGAIGSVVGGFLAKSGEKVTLFGRKPHMETVKKEGLKISGIWGDHLIKGISCYSDLKGLTNHSYDIIFFSVRAYDTSTALLQIAPLVGEDTLVISLQNGLGNIEKIAETIGAEKTVGGRVIFGAKKMEPGHVAVTVYAEEVMLGPLQNTNPESRTKIYQQMEVLSRKMSGAGIPTKPTMEIEKFLWAKVLYNSALNPLSALLSASYGELAENLFTHQIMEDVIREIFNVAQAKKVNLFWDKPEGYIEKFFGQEVPPTAAHRSSMLQAIESGRPVEINALNGAIVEFAKQENIRVPYNDLLTRLVKAKEYKMSKQKK